MLRYQPVFEALAGMENIVRILFCVIFLLAGCTTFPEPQGEEIVNIYELKETLKEFYKAEKSEDWRSYWSYFNPESQKEMPYNEFIKYMEDAPRLSSYKILSITNYGPDREQPDRFKAQVAVDVERRINERGQFYGISESVDLWLHLDGKWVWLARK